MTLSDEPTRVELITALIGRTPRAWSVDPATESTVRLGVRAADRDDCAVFDVSGPMQIVVGSDYVRGVGFSMYELGHIDEFDLGYYLVMANVSDVAAMGAAPIGFLSVVRYPKSLDDEIFLRVMSGINEACAAAGIESVGGDIGGADTLVLSGTALGACAPGGALRRSGARAGDHVFVSGVTGIAGAAMKYFRARAAGAGAGRVTPEMEAELIHAWRRPRAETSLGTALATSGIVTACQDTSDGLKGTLEQIAEASGVGIDLDAHAVPVSGTVAAAASVVGEPAAAITFGDSVDFRLAFTVDGSIPAAEATARFPHGYLIGRVTSAPGVRLLHQDGTTTPVPGKAWRHT
ncbi:thiamine-phosphate kinase [Promicromonospora kroppenstedtii]|uniref:thiamine-phosphate kinase n=1 Tax=Promicromonospora kroppenstedtii TaxID=440482 RepID=UPI0004B8DAA6|nr:thiamine-phosphate kinase [Promicromonospora kroppenstedtii]